MRFEIADVVMMSIFCSVVSFCLRGNLAGTSPAIKAMEENGYHDVAVTDQHGVMSELYGCNDVPHDVVYEVAAYGHDEKQIKAVVCCEIRSVMVGKCTIKK